MDEATAIETVVAPLNYLVADGVRPAAYMYEPPRGVPRQRGNYALHAVPIRNGRQVGSGLSLDVEGLALASYASAVTDFYDEAQIAAIYYPEMERLLQQLTGADKVVVFDHTRRGGSLPPEAKAGLRDPVRRVHNDYTPKSGPQRVRDLLPPAEAEARLRHRYAIINVWRPVRGPLEEAPLALCDARSVAPADLIGNDQVYRDRIGETYTVAFSPAHRWYYFPRMRTDEVALIKSYDSATDGTARFTPHSAFDDPTKRAGALPRESIEIRALVFYPPG